MVALTGFPWARSAFGVEPAVEVEVRVDLRSDRSANAPTVRLEHASARDGVDVVGCLDDGSGQDSIASDRLWLCRGSVMGSGPARLVLVEGAGGAAERVLHVIAVKLVPGRKLRWSWSSRVQVWPADRQVRNGHVSSRVAGGEGGILPARQTEPDVPGPTTGGADGQSSGRPTRPGGPAALTRYFSLPVAYESPGREVEIPSRLRPPGWRALFALGGALAGVVGARALWRALAVRIAWRRAG